MAHQNDEKSIINYLSSRVQPEKCLRVPLFWVLSKIIIVGTLSGFMWMAMMMMIARDFKECAQRKWHSRDNSCAN